MRRRLLVVVPLSLLALAVAIGFVLPSGPSEVPTHTVQRRDFAVRITAEGLLKPVRTTPIGATVTWQGPLRIAWMQADGTRVAEGDVVVRFDPTDMETLLLEGEVGRAVAEGKLNENAAQTLATLTNLGRDRDLAAQELDLARTFQSKDPDIFSRNDIIESELDAHVAASKVDHATEQQQLKKHLSSLEQSIFTIEKEGASRKIDQAEEGLSQLEVRAPHDGIFILVRDWRGEPRHVGDVVFARQPIAELPALAEMEAEVHVLEADAGRLELGARADVVLEAHSEETYPATIERFDRVPQPKRRGVPVQYFAVDLSLERTDPKVMKPGQRVRASLTLGEWDDVIVVPRQAIIEDSEEDRLVVFRRHPSDGLFEPVAITLGPSTAAEAVVESGLEAGDVVALRDPRWSRDELVPLERASTEP